MSEKTHTKKIIACWQHWRLYRCVAAATCVLIFSRLLPCSLTTFPTVYFYDYSVYNASVSSRAAMLQPYFRLQRLRWCSATLTVILQLREVSAGRGPIGMLHTRWFSSPAAECVCACVRTSLCVCARSLGCAAFSYADCFGSSGSDLYPAPAHAVVGGLVQLDESWAWKYESQSICSSTIIQQVDFPLLFAIPMTTGRFYQVVNWPVMKSLWEIWS